MPIKTLITGEIHPGNYPQRPAKDCTLRLIHLPDVFVIRKGRFGQISDFYSILLPQKMKTPIKSTITDEIHSGIYPQRPALHNPSRMIHFLVVFVVRKGRYGQICDFYSILLPKK